MFDLDIGIPKLTISDTSPVAGNNITLTCNVTGYPLPKYEFLREEHHISSGYEASYVFNTTKFDTAEYRCQATNYVGMKKSASISISVRRKFY